mmetsp:Transcript_34458/g.103171  ORF Transcript_34458/g.103171 Transcript_34458/m.103171 type:complete len:261 (-) Transcript_34458:667-1449(-)
MAAVSSTTSARSSPKWQVTSSRRASSRCPPPPPPPYRPWFRCSSAASFFSRSISVLRLSARSISSADTPTARLARARAFESQTRSRLVAAAPTAASSSAVAASRSARSRSSRSASTRTRCSSSSSALSCSAREISDASASTALRARLIGRESTALLICDEVFGSSSRDAEATSTACLSSASAASRSARSSSARAAALRSCRICRRSSVVRTGGGSKGAPSAGKLSRCSSAVLCSAAASTSVTWSAESGAPAGSEGRYSRA